MSNPFTIAPKPSSSSVKTIMSIMFLVHWFSRPKSANFGQTTRKQAPDDSERNSSRLPRLQRSSPRGEPRTNTTSTTNGSRNTCHLTSTATTTNRKLLPTLVTQRQTVQNQSQKLWTTSSQTNTSKKLRNMTSITYNPDEEDVPDDECVKERIVPHRINRSRMQQYAEVGYKPYGVPRYGYEPSQDKWERISHLHRSNVISYYNRKKMDLPTDLDNTISG